MQFNNLKLGLKSSEGMNTHTCTYTHTHRKYMHPEIHALIW